MSIYKSVKLILKSRRENKTTSVFINSEGLHFKNQKKQAHYIISLFAEIPHKLVA